MYLFGCYNAPPGVLSPLMLPGAPALTPLVGYVLLAVGGNLLSLTAMFSALAPSL
eukprot:SAG31_NODE_4385_length_3281_cov_137.482401_6_plen_55_part_00